MVSDDMINSNLFSILLSFVYLSGKDAVGGKGGKGNFLNSFLRQHDLVQVQWVFLSLDIKQTPQE
jgi:hypothetical protein